jgi:integrase/recombinase XerD
MTSNPTDGIRLMQFDEVTKAILSLKEIQKLAITPCPNNEVKRAFLFSCYCGLRWCDVHQLQYKDIDFSSNRLTILQQKVQSHSKNAILHLNLNHTAIKLLQRHKGINEELLDGKDCPVNELFSRCGFASKSVFYVAFRKVVGMTPLRM